jgi:hypothetical protein
VISPEDGSYNEPVVVVDGGGFVQSEILDMLGRTMGDAGAWTCRGMGSLD